MRILFVSSEVAPFSKTGGLADVAGALPRALAALGHEVHVVSPKYSKQSHSRAEQPAKNLSQIFIENDAYFGRAGIYGDAHGDYPDNAQRFAFLCRAALDYGVRSGLPFDIVHVNDWQTGLIPLLLKTEFAKTSLAKARSVITLHNVAYQGNFPFTTAQELKLPHQGQFFESLEFYGQLSFLKAGMFWADAITTVSPTYADEVRTPIGGHGMDGVLRSLEEKLSGILNGIDTHEWNPSTDHLLAKTYSASTLEDKQINKTELLRRMHLLSTQSATNPLFGVIGRMVEQKGVSLVQAIIPELVRQNACLVVLGSGDKVLEKNYHQLQKTYPNNISIQIGYDETLAHMIEAGSDFFLMPSLFEPCGLNQMYSLMYGTIPIVRRVGGLADTVVDVEKPMGNGFLFSDPTPVSFLTAIDRAFALYRDPSARRAVQQRGMQQDFSWNVSAKRYVELYHRLTVGKSSALK